MKFFGIVILLFNFVLGIDVLPFDLIKMPTQKKEAPLVLIIGGIQGDEPGGFNAANLFLQYYKILQGEVWVIPNLNRHSILRNHRGIYGDMNRKFASLSSKDAEYQLIQQIKEIILDKQIQVIYHLHDGSGFYRETFINKNLNPNRWGNSSIIDQVWVEGGYYEDLLQLSQKTINNINQNILRSLHTYHIRNTQTAKKDKEMEKSLTFFAIKNHKTALANEASKNLPLVERIYYHLLGIEGMLRAVGVKFERSFPLSIQGIKQVIYDPKSYVTIEDHISIPLFGLRPKLLYFPFPKDKKAHQIALQSNQHILGFLPRGNEIVFKYGNKTLTTFSPLYLEFSDVLPSVEIIVDGKKEEAVMGGLIKIKKEFCIVLPQKRYRVNVIGYQGKKESEDGEKITFSQMLKQYSIDKKGKKYRIEFYEENKFLGMIIADFS